MPVAGSHPGRVYTICTASQEQGAARRWCRAFEERNRVARRECKRPEGRLSWGETEGGRWGDRAGYRLWRWKTPSPPTTTVPFLSAKANRRCLEQRWARVERQVSRGGGREREGDTRHSGKHSCPLFSREEVKGATK
ncbi:hypothetical protein MTO96_001506 [Rhipicephalus appendiculatus]